MTKQLTKEEIAHLAELDKKKQQAAKDGKSIKK